MPTARCQRIAAASLNRLRSAGATGRASPHRQRPPFRRRSSTISNAERDGDVVEGVEGGRSATTPKVATEKLEGRVSPLIRLESAVIGYPPPPSIPNDDVEFDCGLNDDWSEIDGDLLLESQRCFDGDGDADRNRKTQQRLQRHWNVQKAADAGWGDDGNDSSAHRFDPFDLNIWPNLECGSEGGGHVVLGRNASGKTLLSRALVHKCSFGSDEGVTTASNASNDNPYLQSGRISINKRSPAENRNHRFLSHVSFDSHSSLLLDPRTTTVHRALIPSGGNRLSPTAKFLSVRLGMFPLLPRFVHTLSTGEIRRVLLVRALVSRPEILMLDNAFDGLDVAGREGLRDVVRRVLEGFRMDILVQGVGDARDAARTQVLLFTHRPEEIAAGMGRVTFVRRIGGGDGDRSVARTEDRMGRDGDDLVRSLVAWEEGETAEKSNQCEKLRNVDDVGGNCVESGEVALNPWDIASDLPSNAEITDFWECGKSRCGGGTRSITRSRDLVRAENLKVTREDTTLLSHLNWTVQRGERWHLAGANGAGKSTLARLLLSRSIMNNNNLLEISNTNTSNKDSRISDGSLDVATPFTTLLPDAQCKRGGVGWVSTELHLHAAHRWGDRTVFEILIRGAIYLFHEDKKDNNHSSAVTGDSFGNPSSVNVDIAVTAARWLGLLSHSGLSTIPPKHSSTFLSRHFSSLSQGEQKLVLVASALAQRPSLLVLDEPCQGLDLWKRDHLLGLVERICRVTDMGLLYVTHHEEELIPSIGHRLCLENGKVTFCGPK